MDIHRLLNPEVLNRPAVVDNSVDILPLLKHLETFSEQQTELRVPPEISSHLTAVLRHLENLSIASSENPNRTLLAPDRSANPVGARKEDLNVKITRETSVETLYTYPKDAILEYPETSATGWVGHLFPMDTSNWMNPVFNIAYSKGKPGGQSTANKPSYVDVLRHSRTGKTVPCVRFHSTCQGMKVCPYIDQDLHSVGHTSATRADIQERLENDRLTRVQSSSPSKDVFLRTVAYLAAIQKLGCMRPLSEQTFRTSSEEEEREARDLYLFQIQRGYRVPDGICEGRIVFDYNEFDKPYVCCGHYVPGSNKDHFRDYSVGSGAYNVDYIEAVITGDDEEAARIEAIAEDQGYGPLVECTTVANHSTQRIFCNMSHRDPNGALVQPLLTDLACNCKFCIYEPVEEYRQFFPFVLIMSMGKHEHPVPLPLKTPPKIRDKVMDLLKQLQDDLPDITPRRFLRHPILKAFLSTQYPSLISPTLADWHVSLANRDHVRAYIKDALKEHYPFRTGWAGVIHLKEYQDSKLPKKDHYIRRILAIRMDPRPAMVGEEDEDIMHPKDNLVRIIICMAPEASRRIFLSGRHLQSDTSFRRIVGFKEFEVAGMDRDLGIIYARIYLNSMSALTHQRIFEEIDQIVFEDTGRHLQWHHLHATSPEDGLDSMILSWTADQHRGQAKGLGLYLQQVASKMPMKHDLYQTTRRVQDLGPYEHLHRLFRVCTVHYARLVKECRTTDAVRWLMRSLVCMEHPDWDRTIEQICELGGKVRKDWVQNKLSGGFVFEGICWQKSFMPREIWEAGDNNSNLIESVHRDVNREGVHCTLLGGLKKGQQLDTLKMKTLDTFEKFGITPSYQTSHISENAVANMKRRDKLVHRSLVAQDIKIEAWNEKLHILLDTVAKADKAAEAKEREFVRENTPDRQRKIKGQLDALRKKESSARFMLEKHYQAAEQLVGLGSGKVVLQTRNIQT
ncbi:hypothetical protein C8R43DRAFT_947296 [Mycena crocata]|nr:hypothetical protein C8R43DRAFT_947296 [Mycena crocata]